MLENAAEYLSVLLGIEFLNAGGGSNAYFVPLAQRALVSVFYWMEPNRVDDFSAGAAIKHDVAAFGVEILPLLTERGNVDEIVV